MKRVFAVAVALALLGLCITAQGVTIDTITVGDPGNAGELSGTGAGGNGPDRVCGSVAYTYNIGKYEVTAAQYTAFLNAVAATDTYGLYNASMSVGPYACGIQRSGSSGSYSYSVKNDWANRPVNYVSYWDACRFANWLHNGQPTGVQDASSTERGAYSLDGYNGVDGRNIQRNSTWKWAVTSEDEWYKAAYYKGGGTSAGYWDYPTQSNTAPSNVLGDPTDSGNKATYYRDGYTIGSPYYRTEVGAHENSSSTYGTFDQGGNVWEWNEAIVFEDSVYAYRGLWGGSFGINNGINDILYGNSDDNLKASNRDNYRRYGDDSSFATYEVAVVGFRVSAVPEPSSILAMLCGLGSIGLLKLRKR